MTRAAPAADALVGVEAQTVEAEPDDAAAVFADALAGARAYARLLVTEGVRRGVIGPREPERIWSRHLLNATLLSPYIPVGSTVIDIGSGAGVPGIPLALARPDLSLILLEPMLRRVEFLQLCCKQLQLPIRVVRARAEEAGVTAEVAIARAVAPLDRLVTLAASVLARPGLLLAMKGRSVVAELAGAHETLRRLGAEAQVVVPPTGAHGSAIVAVRFVGASRGARSRTADPARHTGRRTSAVGAREERRA